MFWDLIIWPILVFFLSLGVALPFSRRMALAPPEQVVAGVALSLLILFLAGWTVYILALPRWIFWLLPLSGAAGFLLSREGLRTLWRDHAARNLVIGQTLITVWSIGCLALVKSYSGGAWVGDWFGHLQRTWYFLEHGPREILFNGFDALTSRPPLANIVMGALLAVTRQDFAHYQMASTLLGSLVFLPAALLAHRCGGPRASALLVVLLMAHPMYVQNVTFAWTKLPAAFFCLTGLYFFLRALEAPVTPLPLVLCAMTLGAGILTHYSVGPYTMILAIAWLVMGRRHRGTTFAQWSRATMFAALAGALVLTCWFGWAVGVYGVRGTFLTNTTVTDQAGSLGSQLQVVGGNVRDTLIPHFLRSVNWEMFVQASGSGWWRDWFFSVYQLNLFFAAGSAAWLGILVTARSDWRDAAQRLRVFWVLFVSGAFFLGIAAHGGRDTWGLAHICLQPLVLLGLAYLAAGWGKLDRNWQRLLLAGAVVDFGAGVVLSLGVQSGLIDGLLFPNRSPLEILSSYSTFAQANLQAKLANHWTFVSDARFLQPSAIILLLCLVLTVALMRVNRGDSRIS